jgi:hypothetical protein
MTTICVHRLSVRLTTRSLEVQVLSLNHDRLHIETLIMMNDDCPIRYIAAADHVEFTIGDRGESFEFATSIDALDKLIAMATEAREVARQAAAAEYDQTS